jgi:hypothetical protein
MAGGDGSQAKIAKRLAAMSRSQAKIAKQRPAATGRTRPG